MTAYKDYEKILEFIYSIPDLPEDLRSRFERWMLDREEDMAFEAAFKDLWYSKEIDNDTLKSVDPEALARLLSEIGESKPAEKNRRFNLPRILRYAAVAAAVILSSVATYVAVEKTSHPRTVLVSAKGSTGEFTLPDGSRVLLNSDSRLTYCDADFSKGGKRKVAVDGEAFFDVTRDESRPFVVDMGKMDVEVLGTTFDVRNYSFSKTDEVVLLSGKVKVRTDGKEDNQRILHPDQRFVMNKKSGGCSVEDVSAVNYCRWTSPRLKLENEPLYDILVTLSRKYCLDLEVSPDVDRNFKLSLTLSNESIDEIMPIITFLSGINYTISGNTLAVSK